jgi:hypothetical protein
MVYVKLCTTDRPLEFLLFSALTLDTGDSSPGLRARHRAANTGVEWQHKAQHEADGQTSDVGDVPDVGDEMLQNQLHHEQQNEALEGHQR